MKILLLTVGILTLVISAAFIFVFLFAYAIVSSFFYKDYPINRKLFRMETDCMRAADPFMPCIKCGKFVKVHNSGAREVMNMGGWIAKCPVAKKQLEALSRIKVQATH
jgi:hypothetical protein